MSEGYMEANDMLEPPRHVIDPDLFVLWQNPFAPAPSPDQKQSSTVIIFSVWKTMLGSAVVSLPWAFQQAGLGLSLCITFISFIVGWYTCSLIIDQTGD